MSKTVKKNKHADTTAKSKSNRVPAKANSKSKGKSKSSSKTNVKSRSKTTKRTKRTDKKRVSSCTESTSDEIVEVRRKKVEKKEDTYQKECDALCELLRENYAQHKKLISDLKAVEAKYCTNLKLGQKSNNGTGSSMRTDITKVQPVPNALRKLLKMKEEEATKSKVIAIFHDYLTKNNMCDAKTKRITPNSKVRQVFGMDKGDVMDYYNLQSWINKVYVA